MKKNKYKIRHYNYKCPNCGVEGTIETDVLITTRPRCKSCDKRKVEWTSIVELGQNKIKKPKDKKKVRRKKS